MKKIYLLAVLISFSLIAFSQGARLGVCVNPTINWLSENVVELESNGPKMGLEGGLIFEYYFTKNYAFNTSLKIGNYGGNIIYNRSVAISNDTLINDVKYKLQYISIPAGLKLKTNEIGYFTWYAVIGFTPQLNIGSKAEVEGRSEDISIDKGVGLMNLCYHFGGGLEYGVGGNTAINVGIVYNNGFIDVLSKQGDREKLSFLTLQLGVMF